MSYKGKKKGGNYGQQRRRRFSNPFHRRKRNEDDLYGLKRGNPTPYVNQSGDVITENKDFMTHADIPGELWIRSPTSWTYNGFRARLSPDPNQLQAQALTIARLAAKRKLQIELISGDTTQLFDVLGIGEIENPEAPITLNPQLEPLQIAMQTLGYAIVPVATEEAAPSFRSSEESNV